MLDGLQIVCAVLCAALAALAARYQYKTAEYEKRERRLFDFLKTVHVYEYIDSDIIVLGPQNAGKTVLVRTLTQFWKAHRGTSATVSFELHEFIFPKHRIKSAAFEFSGIRLDIWVRARVKIWDYGGEPRLLNDALSKIESIKKCSLLLVLNAEVEFRSRNFEYFSTNFAKKLDTALSDRQVRIDNVFVIFTKVDLVDGQHRSIDYFEKEFSSCLHKIRSVFNENDVFLVSSEKGDGIPDLIQSISSIFVDEEGLPLYRAPPRTSISQVPLVTHSKVEPQAGREGA